MCDDAQDPDLQGLTRAQLIQALEETREELAHSKRKAECWDLVLKASRDAVWDCDVATGLVHWHDHNNMIIGKDELGERSAAWSWWEERVHPKDRSRVTESLHDALNQRVDHWVCDYRFRGADGEYLHVVDRAFISRDNKGRARRIVGTMRDMTEIRALQDHLTAAVSGGTVALWDTDLETGHVWYDREWETLLGYSREEITESHASINDWVHPDELEYMWEQVRLHTEDGAPLDFQCRLRHKEGHYIWVRASGKATFDADDNPIRISGATRDISERVEFQEALVESRKNFQTLTDTIHEIFWIQNARTGALEFISGTERVLGIPSNTIRENRRYFLELIHPEDREEVMERLQEMGQGNFTLEYRLLLPDGDLRWVRTHAYPRFNEAEELDQIAGVTMDVTEQRQLAQSLRIAAETERMTMGKHVHDTLCGDLPSLSIRAKILAKSLKEKHPELAQEAMEITEQLKLASTTARQLAKGLSPLLPAGQSLREALCAYLREMNPRFKQVRCPLTCPAETKDLDPLVATQVFLITREAIHNALRHGQATRVDICIWIQGESVWSSVTDDGIGRAETLHSATGIGLKSMKYRAQLLDGTLSIRNNPDLDRGLQVLCRVSKNPSNQTHNQPEG